MLKQGLLLGIGFFSLEIIHLISLGKKETLTEIEKHFSQCDIVEYITNKYEDDIFIKFDNSSYDNEAINKYFNDYDGFIQGNENREYGIVNEEDGLLLILALITDKVEDSIRK